MSPIPPEIFADMQHAAKLAVSGTHDPEFERRIHLEAKRIREEILKKHGILDVGVPAIRELRDGE